MAAVQSRGASFHYVYLLRSEPFPAQTCIGYTRNLRLRLAYHNKGQSPHTAKFRPWRIIAALAFTDKYRALAFERYLKSHSGHAFASKRLW